jgi:hypothetical protein
MHYLPTNGCVMVLPPVAPELIARLANYTIDDRARMTLRDLSAVLEPHLGQAIDEVIAGAARLPQVAETTRRAAMSSAASRFRNTGSC